MQLQLSRWWTAEDPGCRWCVILQTHTLLWVLYTDTALSSSSSSRRPASSSGLFSDCCHRNRQAAKPSIFPSNSVCHTLEIQPTLPYSSRRCKRGGWTNICTKRFEVIWLYRIYPAKFGEINEVRLSCTMKVGGKKLCKAQIKLCKNKNKKTLKKKLGISLNVIPTMQWCNLVQPRAGAFSSP